MGTTTRFGFEWFDADEEGSTTDKGGKFTGSDRLTLDNLLATVENHDHKYNPSTILLPDGAPTAALGTSGSLEAGYTYYYSISFVDENGLETPAGDEAELVTDDILPAPEAPSGETATGGDLLIGSYDYGLTAIRGTEQSVLGDLFGVTLITGDGSVDLTLPDLGDADSYNIWRRKDTESGFTLIGNDATGSFTDDGSVGPYPYPLDPTYAPPSENEGINVYSATVELNATDAVSVQEYAGWKLYRTAISGDYPAQSLVAFVTEREDELDPESDLVTSYIDLGDDLVTGTPTSVDLRMLIQPMSFDITEIEPEVAPYPEGYPILIGEDPEFKVKFDGAWVPVGGGGGSSIIDTLQGEWYPEETYAEGDLVRSYGHLWLSTANSNTDTPMLFDNFTDDFARADNTDLGAPWIEEGSDLLISSESVISSYSSEEYANMGPSAVIDVGDDINPNITVYYDNYVSGHFGIILYADSINDSYVGIRLDGTNLKIYEDSSEVYSAAQVINSSGLLQVSFSTYTGLLNIYLDGSNVFSDYGPTYPRIAKTNYHGFSVNGSVSITDVSIDINPGNNWKIVL